MSNVIEAVGMERDDDLYGLSIIEDGGHYSVAFKEGLRRRQGRSGIAAANTFSLAAKQTFDALIKKHVLKGYQVVQQVGGDYRDYNFIHNLKGTL